MGIVSLLCDNLGVSYAGYVATIRPSPKKLRLSLAIGWKNLDDVSMGLVECMLGTDNKGLVRKKKGRHVGSLNKLLYGMAWKKKIEHKQPI